MSITSWLSEKLADYMLKDIKPARSYLCDFSRVCHEARPADVLLIEGRNRVSRTIQTTTKSPWTHSALFIGRIHSIEDPKLREYVQHNYKGASSEQLIIESQVGLGTIIAPITKYQHEHMRLCRPTGLSHDDGQKVIQYAVDNIGHDYDLRHFFDLYRFLVSSWFIPRTFKSRVFKKKVGKVGEDICSTMIAKAFESVHFPVLPLIRKGKKDKLEIIRRNPNLFAPCDFDYSPYFDIIKYPMIPVSGFNVYRHLPWHKELMSNDDQGIVLRDDYKEKDA